MLSNRLVIAQSIFLLISILLTQNHHNGYCTAFVLRTGATTTKTKTKIGTTSNYDDAAASATKRNLELSLFRSLDEKIATNGENGQDILNNGSNQMLANGNNKVAFLVERLRSPRDEVYKEIAEMCISVFFNNGMEGRAMPPWKEFQLSYLRMIQMADLRRRRSRDKNTNAMFVAYKVEEYSSGAAQTKPLILNNRNINNLSSIASSSGGAAETDYVRGEILGFCEVSMVPFGLAPPTNVPPLPNGYMYDDDEAVGNDNLNSRRLVPKRMRDVSIPRPVLTNLSVKVEARSSGVGSKLLDACERVASGEWGKREIVLEVEDDNTGARTWYQKRGYRILFSDPTSRRYDTTGLFLRKVGCTRQILRKALNSFSSSGVSSDPAKDYSMGGLSILKKLRDNVLQVSS